MKIKIKNTKKDLLILLIIKQLLKIFFKMLININKKLRNEKINI